MTPPRSIPSFSFYERIVDARALRLDRLAGHAGRS